MSSRPIKRLLRSLNFRLALWYSSVFISSAVVLFALVFIPLRLTFLEEDRDIVLAKLQEYSLQGEQLGEAALIAAIHQEELSNHHNGFIVRVLNHRGNTLVLTLPLGWERADVIHFDLATSLEPGAVSWGELPATDRVQGAEFASRVLPGGIILQVGKDAALRERHRANFRKKFAFILLPAVIFGFCGGFFLASRALRPIRELIHTVRSIDTGRLDARVPDPRTGDELNDLVHLFNGMLEKISSLITGMRDALDNVAHDLRTPATRLRATIETALQAESDPEALREALMDCGEESERLTTMLSTLMDISEAETGVMRLRIKEIDVAELLNEVVDLYQYVADDKEITVLCQVPPTLSVRADSDRMRQVVANLLDNAIKYTPVGGQVSVTARRQEEEIAVEVSDNGAGIAEQDLPHIFDRLYRGDRSRSQRGLGLGLSLVEAVTHSHGGRTEVESTPGVGSTFTLFLPVAGPAA